MVDYTVIEHSGFRYYIKTKYLKDLTLDKGVDFGFCRLKERSDIVIDCRNNKIEKNRFMLRDIMDAFTRSN